LSFQRRLGRERHISWGVSYIQDLLPHFTRKNQVNYIKIGDAQIATFPGEVLPKLGFRVKDAMESKYKFVFGLANDELGYILAEEDFNKELYKYEKSMSIGSKIGTMTTEALTKMLVSP